MKINYEPNQQIKTNQQLAEEFNRNILASRSPQEVSNKVPIKRGCPVRNGGCLCSGICQEIIGWRDKVPGEF